MWQKAKVVKVFHPDKEGVFLGRTLWLQAQPPTTDDDKWTSWDLPAVAAPRFKSNLYRRSAAMPDGRDYALIEAETVELLPIFEENIEPMLFSEWAAN